MTVAADIIFMNRIQFLVSVSRGANFTMVDNVRQRLKAILTESIGKAFQFYKNNRYNIKKFLIDGDFECIRDSLSEESNINTTPTTEHVP